MLIDAPAAERIDVAVVVEDDRCSANGVHLTATLRKAGIAAELVLSGSPRKRYDKL